MTGWWSTQACLAFDLETTGVDPHADRIVTASVVRVVPGKTPVTFDWIADPGVEIPDGAAAIHGITTEKAREVGQPVGQVLFEVTGHLAWALGHGIPVVAMNASYDLTMLEAENARHGVDTLLSRVAPIGPIIDPGVLDRYADKYRRGGRKLTDLCAQYGVTLEDAHTSSADALAAGLLWPLILDRHPAKFRGLDLVGLHQGQVGWRREQMDGLRAYFDRNGTQHDGCSGDWPILSRPAAEQQTLGGVA